MSYTNGDDPQLDAEIEGAKARIAGCKLETNPYKSELFQSEEDKKCSASWESGWNDEDARITAKERHRPNKPK